jgi:hypothetical protein
MEVNPRLGAPSAKVSLHDERTIVGETDFYGGPIAQLKGAFGLRIRFNYVIAANTF